MIKKQYKFKGSIKNFNRRANISILRLRALSCSIVTVQIIILRSVDWTRRIQEIAALIASIVPRGESNKRDAITPGRLTPQVQGISLASYLAQRCARVACMIVRRKWIVNPKYFRTRNDIVSASEILAICDIFASRYSQTNNQKTL